MFFYNILYRLGICKVKNTASSTQSSCRTGAERDQEQRDTQEKLIISPTSENNLNSCRSIPTVGLRKELIDAFTEAFTSELQTMPAFSNDEISEMLFFINSSEDGFINKGAWMKPVYNKYFNREWNWPVYDNFVKWMGGNPENDKYKIFQKLIDFIHGQANSIDRMKSYKRYGGWINESERKNRSVLIFIMK